MKNETNDGLCCDYCGDETKSDFTYYSLDFKEVSVYNHSITESENPIISIDLCERCMELFRQRLIEISKAIPETSSRCDVSGLDVTGQPRFYRCYISKVVVDLTRQPYTCSVCQKPRNPQQGPCDCSPGPTKLLRVAKVDVDKDYLRLNFSEQMYIRFKSHTLRIRGIGESTWA